MVAIVLFLSTDLGTLGRIIDHQVHLVGQCFDNVINEFCQGEKVIHCSSFCWREGLVLSEQPAVVHILAVSEPQAVNLNTLTAGGKFLNPIDAERSSPDVFNFVVFRNGKV